MANIVIVGSGVVGFAPRSGIPAVESRRDVRRHQPGEGAIAPADAGFCATPGFIFETGQNRLSF